jgi:hypothetical protein
MAVTITTEDVLKCIAEVAPLTTPHKDRWRVEHLQALCKDPDCAVAFTDIIGAMVGGDVTDDTCDLMSSATLVILLKKTEEEIEALGQKQGSNYRQPQRHLGMGSTIPKIAANCVIAKVQLAIGVSAGAH